MSVATTGSRAMLPIYTAELDDAGGQIEILIDLQTGAACWQVTVGAHRFDLDMDVAEARRVAVAMAPDLGRLVQAAEGIHLALLGEEAKTTPRSQTRLVPAAPLVALSRALVVVHPDAHAVITGAVFARLRGGALA